MQNHLEELIRLTKQPTTVPKNPRVSALVVSEKNEVIAFGVHRGKGSVHAEIDALSKLSGDLSSCTLYVSLEPCNHFGSTPPCTDAIIKSGIRNLVIGSLDPNQSPSGGLKKLIDSKIKVTLCSDQTPFLELNRRWFESIRLNRIFVALKTASSIDGFIAKSRNQRYQLTSQSAINHSHQLRGEFDAILVGTNTAAVDNPRLTIRNISKDTFTQPLRVIMGKRKLSSDLNLFDSEAETVQVMTHDPHEVVETLRSRGINSLLVEGGARVQTAFLNARLVDELHVFMANKFFGDGLNMFEQINETARHLEIKYKNVISLDPDILIQANVFGS